MLMWRHHLRFRGRQIKKEVGGISWVPYRKKKTPSAISWLLPLCFGMLKRIKQMMCWPLWCVCVCVCAMHACPYMNCGSLK
jgi:hypothetical protein